MNEWKKYIAPAAVVITTPGAAYAVQYLDIEAAQKLCFPVATVFEPAHIVFTPEQTKAIETRSGEKVTSKGQQIWRAKNGEKLLGYFIVDYVIGKHLIIDYAVALTPDGAVAKVEIMQYRESHGDEIRGEDWRKQFTGKTCESDFTLNNEIINISGATLSCRHVTDGIRRVLATFCVAPK